MDYRNYLQDVHLSRSFFMRKRFSDDNSLIFYKRFLYPIIISQEKCLSYLKIRGFKSWKTPFLETLLQPPPNENDNEKYCIRISIGETEKTIYIPPIIFLCRDIDRVIDYLKKCIQESLGHVNFINFFSINGLIFLKIINAEITMMFSDGLCEIFNFKKNFSYTKNTPESLFFYKNSFKSFKGEHIGVSVNFACSNNMGDGGEMISILSTENVPFSSYYEKCIIDRPEKLSIRSDSIIEIEIRFINLHTGTIYKSIFEDLAEDIFVSMNFSNI